MDGAIRDAHELAEMNSLVWYSQISGGQPRKEGPAFVNIPIACGGVVVNPGDLIVADGDGVIVVPRGDAESAVQRAVAWSGLKMRRARNSWRPTANPSLNLETTTKR